jgi:Arc/MetJ-type ribon-helix-helix transcriptional regulator
MAVTERITVRLPADRLILLQSLVTEGKYDNISDVVRTAVDEFVEEHFTSENIAKITVDFPKNNVMELESLVRNGDSISLDDAIRNAVREYTKAHIKQN